MRGGRRGDGYVKDSNGKVIAEMGKDGEVRDHHALIRSVWPRWRRMLLIDDDWL